MLISCTSCNSKYLINSADLNPNGRVVQCANCGNQWHQDINIVNKEEISEPSILTNLEKNTRESSVPAFNLPSTYVKEQKASILNTTFAILVVIFLFFCFWLFRNLEMNTFVLIQFYIDEFYYNLKLIINDMVKIIHKIIN